MKEKAKPETMHHAGISDFLKMMYDGQPEWAIIAVKAPVEEVSEDYADFIGSGTVLRDVQKKTAADAQEVEDDRVAAVQSKGSAWTVIYRSLFYVDEELSEAVPEEAKEMSARLSTRAISFIGEETSGANSYKLFEKGKLLEDIEWEDGGQFFRWKSSVRKRPQIEQVDDKFIEEVFREHGIYVAACYPVGEAGNSWLAIEKSSAEAVERVDLIEFEEGEKEDEDEDEDADEE